MAAITLIGPTHPYSGGIAQHTTRLALELESRGHQVVVESWKAQYPKALYRGTASVDKDHPEIGVPSQVFEKLTWYNPLTWWRAGGRMRASEIAAFSIPTPFHAIPYLLMILATREKTRTIGILHNVRPHEPGPFDHLLMNRLLRSLDRLIVHGHDQAELAHLVGGSSDQIMVRALPSPWLSAPTIGKRGPRESVTRLLFFGTIRAYKGLDRLLEALAHVDDVELLIAGEFWEDEQRYRKLVAELDLESRVSFRSGYVPDSEFREVFGACDVLVLPYYSGSGSIVRELAFQFGLAVIATKVGAIAEGIEHLHTGFIIDNNSLEQLTEALRVASSREMIERWHSNVVKRSSVSSEQWQAYCTAILK